MGGLTDMGEGGKITPMKETRTVKIWLSTYRLLKVLAAQGGETLVEMLDRLARQEEARQNEQRSN